MMQPTFIDLFAGAGGFGLGFQMAGYKPLLSLEIDKWAYNTLTTNNKHCIINADITKFDTANKIKSICPKQPDVIIGGPPCQGFSNAAARRIKKVDKRNELFRYFLIWVKSLKPKVFVIENVPGILSKTNVEGNKIIDIIKQLAKVEGYYISTWRLNAMNFGIPQNRDRIFIIGHQEKDALYIPESTHGIEGKESLLSKKILLPIITVGEAILDLPQIKAREGMEEMAYPNTTSLSAYQKWARCDSKIVYNHVAMKHTDRIVQRYQNILDGIQNLPKELKVRKRSGGGELSTVKFNQNYRHLAPERVAYTIPASFYSSFIHPTIPRNITTREAARLQSFPDWYQFKGKRTIVSNSLLRRTGKEEDINLSQYNQVGNAVPPLLAKAIAKSLYPYIISKGHHQINTILLQSK